MTLQKKERQTDKQTDKQTHRHTERKRAYVAVKQITT